MLLRSGSFRQSRVKTLQDTTSILLRPFLILTKSPLSRDAKAFFRTLLGSEAKQPLQVDSFDAAPSGVSGRVNFSGCFASDPYGRSSPRTEPLNGARAPLRRLEPSVVPASGAVAAIIVGIVWIGAEVEPRTNHAAKPL